MPDSNCSFIEPYSAVRWPLAAGHSALICIDVQNDVLDDRGQYAAMGVDISHMRRVIQPIKDLTAAARAAGVPIIWTRHGFRNETDAGILLPLRPFLREGGFRPGTWGYEILEELEPRPEDWYVDKNRFSSFFNTNLELILRGMKTETLLITGVLTNQCVSATARDAFHRDIKPVVVEEAVGTTLPELHEPALRMIDVGFGQVTRLDQALAELALMPVDPIPRAKAGEQR